MASTVAHAVNNPLAVLIANLDLAIETLVKDPKDAAPTTKEALELLREARSGAERIRVIVKQMQTSRAPLDRAASVPEMAPVSIDGPPVSSRKAAPLRILIVDDDVAVGKSMLRVLRDHDVTLLENGKDALARLTKGERFDLIFSDLMMPELTGMDLYEEVARLAPEQAQKMVFLTGGAVTTRARDFVANVPNRVLAKPFDVRKLRDLVRERTGAKEGRPDGVVMVVDDDVAMRKLIARWLTNAKLECIEQPSGQSALDALTADPDTVETVVCDVMMPGIDGFELVARLKANPATSAIPIIMATAQAIGEMDVARGAAVGALDYLTKPFSGHVLVAKVRAACERARTERELRTRLLSAEESALRDGLTGLMNRRAFEARLAESMASTSRHKEPMALVMIDVDHFKQVNDTLGHEGGDQVLFYLARALHRAVRTEDQAFRYGGEEFVLLLPKCDAEGAQRVVQRIQSGLRERPLTVSPGNEMIVRFSAGVSAAEEKNDFRVEELVTRADAALYEAKHNGRDRTEIER